MMCTCYGHGLTKGTVIQIFYHGLDDPTQGILDAGGIFLYNTLNEAFKILEDKVLLKLDFLDDPHMSPEPKTVVFVGGSNIHSYHTILSEIFEALATKFDTEFLNIRKELKVMQDGRRGMQSITKFQKTETSTKDMMREWMTRKMEANERMKNQDCTLDIPYTNAKTFADDVLLNHVGDEELKSFDGVGIRRMTKKEKNGLGLPKEPNKEWKQNEKVVPTNKENVDHYLWHPTKIPHLNRIIKES
ncbi:hypothetical protein Tco_1547833 [Tanacetum coccineum]